MKKMLMLTAAILALQALPALAEGSGGHPEGGKRMDKGSKFFDMQDTNKDGAVSEEEMLTFAKARFAEMDGDKDGKVTKEEAKTHREAMKAKWKEKHGDKKKADSAEPPKEAPAE